MALRHANGRGKCRPLGLGRDLAAMEVRCTDDHVGWGETTSARSHRIFIARSGAYLCRINGVETFVDATRVLVIRPGDETCVAHPVAGGDAGTVVELSGELVAALGEEGTTVPSGELHLHDELDLEHRRLLAVSRRGLDSFEATERLLRLLDHLVGQGSPAVAERRRPATIVAHRRLVEHAREALAAGQYVLGLDCLAAALGCSPHHLSRVFRQVTGESVTEYRNRLRVRAVLSDLQDGAANLRELAAEYGFADQSHLTRVVRRQLGRPPSQLRQLIADPRPPHA